MTVMKMSWHVQSMVNEGKLEIYKKLVLEVEHEIEREFIKLNVLNEIKCYILITLMYMPNTCRLVWNQNYMLSEISGTSA